MAWNIAILIFKKFICDDLAAMCLNVVNFGPVTLEFKIGKYVHPVVSFFKINLSDNLSHDPPTDCYQILPPGRHLIVRLLIAPLCPIPQRMLPWQPIYF